MQNEYIVKRDAFNQLKQYDVGNPTMAALSLEKLRAQ